MRSPEPAPLLAELPATPVVPEYVLALEKAASYLPPEQLGLLRRAEAIDPLRDSTQCRLMRVLAASGDVPAALVALARQGLATLGAPGDASLYPALPRKRRRKITAAQLLEDERGAR